MVAIIKFEANASNGLIYTFYSSMAEYTYEKEKECIASFEYHQSITIKTWSSSKMPSLYTPNISTKETKMLYISIESTDNSKGNVIIISNLPLDHEDFDSNYFAIPTSSDDIKANTKAITLRNILYNAGVKDIQLDLIG